MSSLQPWTLRFRDPDVEKSYAKFWASSVRGYDLTVAVLLLILAVLGFLETDFSNEAAASASLLYVIVHVFYTLFIASADAKQYGRGRTMIIAALSFFHLVSIRTANAPDAPMQQPQHSSRALWQDAIELLHTTGVPHLAFAWLYLPMAFAPLCLLQPALLAIALAATRAACSETNLAAASLHLHAYVDYAATNFLSFQGYHASPRHTTPETITPPAHACLILTTHTQLVADLLLPLAGTYLLERHFRLAFLKSLATGSALPGGASVAWMAALAWAYGFAMLCSWLWVGLNDLL